MPASSAGNAALETGCDAAGSATAKKLAASASSPSHLFKPDSTALRIEAPPAIIG